MATQPPPMTFTCPACGWKKTTAPRSDVWLAGVDGFDQCPECGYESLDVRRANAIEALVVAINNIGRRNR
jgi:predicted RNA-binding Zn-ribbon protein involved in translation (DUF1610 family)